MLSLPQLFLLACSSLTFGSPSVLPQHPACLVGRRLKVQAFDCGHLSLFRLTQL